jgi:putative membrane protein
MMGNGFGGVGMWLFGLLTLAGVVLLVVVAVRVFGGGISRATPTDAAGRPPGRGRAREVLDERYARGEISTEEYRERLQALEDR